MALGCGLFLANTNSFAVEYDLSPTGTQSFDLPGVFGGTAKVSDSFTQPTGTGVFEPFLTVDANGHTSTGNKDIEQGYNTKGSPLYLDEHRPEWNKLLRFGDLATIDVGSSSYYGFLLDANEPNASGKLNISVDNIRIYTSSIDHTADVASDVSKLGLLGDLRWAFNDAPSAGNYTTPNWIKLNSSQENVEAGEHASNGGSGKSDMVLYVPVSAFAGVGLDDYVWFYNLNGAQLSVAHDTGADAGFEEWRAVTGPHRQIPDAGSTAALVGIACATLFGARTRRK